MAENNKPYVFISYAHADSPVVLPVVEAMKGAGVNLWYDEGIQAGSEWPEYIAEKVMHCTKFVLFVSPAYLDSQNCRRELNFAISRKKGILSVYIADVALSPGMEMQLGTYQAIFRNRYPDDEAFRRSLAVEPFFDSCREGGAPAQNASVSGGAVPPAPNPVPPTQPPVQPPVPPAPNPGYAPQGGYVPPQGPGYAPQGAPVQPPYQQPPVYRPVPPKNKVIAGLLAIFLGSFGIHKFYLGQNGLGVLHLVFFWTYIPSLVGFIEGIVMLCSSNETLERRYKCRFL